MYEIGKIIDDSPPAGYRRSEYGLHDKLFAWRLY
jgi:hypothetical protein